MERFLEFLPVILIVGAIVLCGWGCLRMGRKGCMRLGTPADRPEEGARPCRR
jgi:hypothetical protein